MRIGLISDIHGNLVALDTVLAELGREPVDQIVCLGDVVEFGPQPRAVLARIRALGCLVVMGNTDVRMATDRRDEPRGPDRSPEDATELWAVDQLTSADRAFIQSFQPSVHLSLDGDITLLGFHGSPRANTDLIFATTPEDELTAMLVGWHATILAGGHTHVQLIRRYRDMLLVNPGSVGLPYEPLGGDGAFRRPPWAEYAIVEAKAGSVSIELRRTPIDVAAVLRSAFQSGMPHPAWWAQHWKY